MRTALLGLLYVFGAAAVRAPEWQERKGFDTKGYPTQMAKAARLAEMRCTKCHTLRRVLRARHKGDAWTDLVDRMMEKEKSGISKRDASTIAAFLAWRSTMGTKARAGRGVRAVTAGDRVYPSPRFAVLASAALPPSRPLPAKLDLDRYAIIVRDVRRATRADGARLTMVSGRIGKRSFDIALGSARGGSPVKTTFSVRAWSIASRRFRLVLAVYAVRQPARNKDRPHPVLALLVERVPK